MQSTIGRLDQRRAELGDQGGFTLIEPLIVIMILGVLAAIGVLAVQNLTRSSLQASCGSDLKTVETAVEIYRAEMGNYPDGYTLDPANRNVHVANGAGLLTDNQGLVNAAASGRELLSAGGSATGRPSPNTGDSRVGPWLKDVPANGNHYTITVSNDGKGTVLVVNAANPNGVSSCSAAGLT
jgi:prepilin-type N-terminal cleavage/methylation domain-containing protein